MAQLTNVRLLIDGQEVNGFQSLNIIQDAYSTDTITISFRLETLEEDNSFFLENSKEYIGKNFAISTEIVPYGNTESEDGFAYQGLITGIDGQRTGSRSGDTITISGNSPDVILKGKPSCRAFHEKTLADIVNEVLQPYPSNILNISVSPRNTDTIPYIVQFMESDYEFIHRLARKFGEWFFYTGQELIFGELPEIDEAELVLGVDLDAFNFSLQTVAPKFKIKTIENTFNDERYSFESGRNNVQQQTNQYVQHAYDQSANLFSEQSIHMYNHINRDVSQLQQGIDDAGNLEEISDLHKMSETNGTGTNKQLKIAQIVDIIHPGSEGGSEQNYGRYRLTAINHYCDHMLNYNNSFTAMQAGIELPENTNINAIVYSKPVRAYVVDNADPENVGRVKVDFAWRSGQEDQTPWIRCASNYTVGDGGSFFVPEVYSEVLVDFVDGDVDQPYVLGSFFSTDVRPFNPPSDWAGDPNNIRAIRTRSGNTIEIHDTDGAEKVIIYDKDEKNKITLDSANSLLSIQTEGELNLSANKIIMEAKEELYLGCDKTVDIEGIEEVHMRSPSGKIRVASAQDMKIEGNNVNVGATASFKAEANASAEVSANGNTTIRGTMVQIN
jgi:uncharacterized protein involved in type VI secretion and phage assembly